MHQGLWIYCCLQKGVLCAQHRSPSVLGWPTRVITDTSELLWTPSPMLVQEEGVVDRDIVRKRLLRSSHLHLTQRNWPPSLSFPLEIELCLLWGFVLYMETQAFLHERIGVFWEGLWHVTCFVQNLWAAGHLRHHCRHYCVWVPL